MSYAPARRAKAIAAGAIPVAAAMVAATATAAPAQADTNHRNKTLSGTHPDWATQDKDRGAVPGTQRISTRVFLTGQDPAGLAAAARAVADPADPQYRQFLTPAQVKARFGATPAQVAAVQNWLTGAGLKISAVQSDWIDAEGDAAAVQRAFGTQIRNYQRSDGTVGYAAASGAQVPAAVADYVAGVSGLMQQSVRAHSDSRKTIDASGISSPYCSSYWGEKTTTAFPAGSNPGATPLLPCSYTSAQLRDAYGITKSGMTGKGATIAVVDWYASSTMHADADKFATAHGDKAFAAGQYSEITTPAQWNSVQACGGLDGVAGEEALDVEMAHGLAPDANILYVGANSCSDGDLLAAEANIVDNHLADVVSNSWGGIVHTTDGHDIDPAVLPAYDRIFAKGALEGIGFTFSSGDCGDADPADYANGGVNCAPDSARRQTEWPASSQWVTAVGGTTLATNAQGGYAWETSMGDHIAVGRAGDPAWKPGVGSIPFVFGGGGGASEDVPQPWYQAGVVPPFLASNLGTPHAGAQPMRTLPDVAMNGSLASAVLVGMTTTDPSTNISTYSEGGFAGTSAAAPAFAALQADAKQAAGHAIGFANPALYALAGTSAFHDVTAHPAGQPQTIEGVYQSASSPANGDLIQVGQDTSLAAATGYDTATGLGSPAADYLARISTLTPPQPPTPGVAAVGRVSGADRYATAVTVSQRAFPNAGSAPAVVLATGENFPDALSGVPLAAKLGAPLLLTPGAGMDPRVAAEVHRVLAAGGKVYVLGGASAVSDHAIAGLNLPAAQIDRIAGGDRFATSLAIAQRLGDPAHVVLATGRNFPDALAAGPFAAAVFGEGGSPAAILLTDDKNLPGGVSQYLSHATAIAAVGGQAVVASAGLPNVTATFLGDTRYDTAAKVAATFGTPKVAGVATGTAFADALTGAALLAEAHGPLILTDPTTLPAPTADALRTMGHTLAGVSTVDVFGGPAAVSNTVEQQIATAVGGRIAN